MNIIHRKFKIKGRTIDNSRAVIVMLVYITQRSIILCALTIGRNPLRPKHGLVNRNVSFNKYRVEIFMGFVWLMARYRSGVVLWKVRKLRVA
jgi:hypothetical protein